MSDHDSYIVNFLRPLIDLLPDWVNVRQEWLDNPGAYAHQIIFFALGSLVDSAAFGEYERYRSHIPHTLFYMIRDYTTGNNTGVPSVLYENPGHEEVVSSLGNSAQNTASTQGRSSDGHVEEEKDDNEEGGEDGFAHHDSDHTSSVLPAPQDDDSFSMDSSLYRHLVNYIPTVISDDSSQPSQAEDDNDAHL